MTTGIETNEHASAARPRVFELLRQDIRRYRGKNQAWYKMVRTFLDNPGLQAIVVYRFGSWVHRNVRFAPIRWPLKLLHYVLQKLMIILWGILISEDAEIGGGFYIGHFGGIMVGPVRMGRDCSIAQQVVIGRRAGGQLEVPTLGDRVWIGAGSIVFGGIRIGDGVTIGPLTVVGRNLPPRVMVMGNPMRLLRKNYDNSLETYGKRRCGANLDDSQSTSPGSESPN